MTTQEQIEIRVAELVALKEARQQAVDQTRLELEANLAKLPVGYMFQDAAGIVYLIVEPTGTYVSFRKIDYQRTRKDGEAKGTLAMKTAEDAGFVLSKGAEKK